MINRITLLMMAATLFAFTGCSDDNDDTPNYVAEITGTYNGYTSATCNMFADRLNDDEVITITANTDNSADFYFASAEFGTYDIKNMIVTKNAVSGYDISASGEISLSMNGTPSTTLYPYTFNGTIRSNTDVDISFAITLPVPMGVITVKFIPGDMPLGSLIAGTYTGYIHAKSSYFDNYYPDMELVITANEDGTVNYNIGIEVDELNNWGIFDVKNLAVTKNESGAYEFSNSGEQSLVMNGATLGPYAYTAKAGIVSAQEAEMAFTFNIMGGTTLTFHTGAVPEE